MFVQMLTFFCHKLRGLKLLVALEILHSLFNKIKRLRSGTERHQPGNISDYLRRSPKEAVSKVKLSFKYLNVLDNLLMSNYYY